jgi:hypothetical protein
MFSDRAFREKLRSCPDPKILLELLAVWPYSPEAMRAPIEAMPKG